MTTTSANTPKRGRKTAAAKPKLAGSNAGEVEREVTTIVTTTDTLATPPVAPAAPVIVEEEPILEEPSTGQFIRLDQDELKDIALFFTKDVDVADAEKGASKKELIAALASSGDGSDPVSWDDYKNIYLPAQTPKRAPVEQKAAGRVDAAERMTEEELAEVAEADDKSNYVLVKMERKNPRYDLKGYTFTHAHPFHSVPPEVAEAMIQSTRGFRLALPTEVQSYYK